MKTHYLRYFAVLAEELHFGRAAERLSITQPPLSSAIKALEDEVGARLFDRDSKQVQLTPAGAAFLVEVRIILERIGRAKDTAKAVASGKRGRLDVGVTGSFFYRELPGILTAFDELMPNIEVILHETGSAEQVEALLHGELHVGFINAATAPPQLKSIPLRADKLAVCLPESHALAHRESLRIADLENEHFVMFDREVAPANYDNVIAAFSRAGVHPRTRHAVRTWLSIVVMVANGFHIGLVPESVARCGIRGVCFVPLVDVGAVSPALIAWNPSYGSPGLDTFVECARRHTDPERMSSGCGGGLAPLALLGPQHRG